MKKNFFKFSLTLNIILAVLSSILMFVFDDYTGIVYDGEAFITFLYYVKELFNLLALFVGFGTIIFAFSRLGFKDGLISVGTFGVSVFISFLTTVISYCIEFDGEYFVILLVSAIFYSFGYNFITQMIPAISIAWVCWHYTKNNTQKMKGFISWKHPIHKTMIVATIGMFLFNVLYYTLVILLPGLIENSFKFETIDEMVDVIITYAEKVVFYLIMQYVVYFLIYKIYDSFIIKYPDKRGRV